MLLLLVAAPRSEETVTLVLVHQQRYAMGTMFDILAYHESRAEAAEAIKRAMAEIVRLDQVLSHFKADSDVSKLVRNGSRDAMAVDRSLYDVLQQSLAVSRASGGRFDVTIAPLLRAWRQARSEGRNPSAEEISEARRCVGFEKIDVAHPDRVRLRSGCLEIDLGGIGKGYAADRALAVLQAAGIRHASINAGSSSIAAIGTPPGGRGWPVRLAAASSSASESRTVRLRDASMSTSAQNGEILDPHTGAAPRSALAVSVFAPNGALADALSTTLVLLSIEDGKTLLARFDGVSAVWMTPDGIIRAEHGKRRRPRRASAASRGAARGGGARAH